MSKSRARPIIFVALSNRYDGKAELLEFLSAEQRATDEALKVARHQLCELVVKVDANLDDIIGQFNDPENSGRIALFHFAGHADAYRLLMTTSAGNGDGFAHAAGLAEFLGAQKSLQLVFLNA